MRCVKCGAENPGGLKFCEQCAAPFKRRCARCGFENSPTARFCGECAAPLSANTETVSADAPQPPIARATRIAPTERTDAADALEGERKTVTAVFADIKGSTELMEDIDPEEARAIIDPALKLMIDAAHRYAATSCNRPATAFSHCSERPSRMRTIRNGRCMPRYGCRMSSSATRIEFVQKADCRSRRG
jgi:ribosomal protein L40E